MNTYFAVESEQHDVVCAGYQGQPCQRAGLYPWLGRSFCPDCPQRGTAYCQECASLCALHLEAHVAEIRAAGPSRTTARGTASTRARRTALRHARKAGQRASRVR